MKYITIPKLYKYQHYKHRKPVWFKVYCDILEDVRFIQLTARQKWYYIGLIILCVKNDNAVPLMPCRLAKRLSLESRSIKKSVLKMNRLGLISLVDDKKMIDKGYQKDMYIREDKIRKDKKGTFNIIKRALDKFPIFRRK